MKAPHPQPELFEDSKSIRVTVPVSPEIRDAFRRLAAAQGVSVGKAMGDWLTDTVEGVEAMADLLERARKAPQIAVREIHAYATGLTDITSELIREVQGRAATQRAAGGRPGRGAPAARPGAADSVNTPPVSNTGGKVTKKAKR